MNVTVTRTETTEWAGAPLPARFAGLVAGWHGYKVPGDHLVSHHALPTPIIPLIVSFGVRHELRYGDGTGLTTRSFVAGLHDRTVVVDADEWTGLQVDLTPLGAFRLLDGNAPELANTIVSVVDALGTSGARYESRIAETSDWAQRFSMVADFLTTRFESGPRVSRGVSVAWRLVEKSGGTARIASIAAEVGWSERHLNSRFRSEIGMSPKRASRIARFGVAAHLLNASDMTIAEVALSSGYVDQAHLTNEATSLAGLTPQRIRQVA